MLTFVLSLPLCDYIIGISLFKNHIILYKLYCFDAIICLNTLCIVSIFESRIIRIVNPLNRESILNRIVTLRIGIGIESNRETPKDSHP